MARDLFPHIVMCFSEIFVNQNMKYSCTDGRYFYSAISNLCNIPASCRKQKI